MLPSLLVGMALVLLTGEGVERSLVSLAGMGLSARRETRAVEKARVLLLLLRRQRLVRRAGSIVCVGVCVIWIGWRVDCAVIDCWRCCWSAKSEGGLCIERFPRAAVRCL